MPMPTLQQIIGTITGKVAFERTQANFTTIKNAHNDLETDLTTHKAESVQLNGVHGLKIEEGIFTPTIKGYTTPGTTTYVANKGFFTKINNTIHFDLVAEGTIIGATGVVFIGGLPFASRGTDAQQRSSCVVGQLSYLNFGTNLEVTAYIGAGDTGILLFFTKPSVGSDYVNITDFIGGQFGIRISGTYTIN